MFEQTPDRRKDTSPGQEAKMRHLTEVLNENDLDIPLVSLMDVLSNERRLRAIRCMAEYQEMSMRKMSECIALAEARKGGSEVVDSDDRKSIYISLLQLHLPRLDDIGIVEYDGDTKEVKRGPYFDDAVDVINSVLNTVYFEDVSEGCGAPRE